MSTKAEVRWSPIQDRFLLWRGDTIATYQVRPRTERSQNGGACAFNLSNAHYAELICSAGNQHHVKCLDLYPHSQGDEIVALGGNSKVTVTYMAKLAWDGSGLPKKEFSAKFPRQCTSVQFNPIDSHWLAVGLEKYKPDNCLLIFDVTQVVCKRDLGFVGEASRPVFEFGLAEHCQNLSWFRTNSKIIAAGINTKYLRLYDVRDPARIVACAVTKAALGVCVNPRDDTFLASHFDNLVYLWDARHLDKPVQIVTQARTVTQIAWCPSKSSLLSVLQKDGNAVNLFDVQSDSGDGGDLSVLERAVKLKCSLGSFSWHPSEESRLICTATQTNEVFECTVHDRVTLGVTPDLRLVWSCGRKVLKSAPLGVEDVAATTRRRAKLNYGLSEEVRKHAELVADDEVLSNVWTWLHLTHKLAEEGKLPACRTTHPGVLSVVTEQKPSDPVTRLWTDLVPNNCKGSVRYYASAERNQALLLCGWPLITDPQAVVSFVLNLERAGAASRAAALAVFNLHIPLAIEVLNRSGKSYAAIALAGYSNEEEGNWRKFCANSLRRIDDHYLRVMFAFLLHPNSSEWVVKEAGMIVDDRVAFALLYLSDAKLHEYVARLSGELSDQGHLDGLLLTGNSPQGLKLLQHYVDRTADVQSAALIAVRAFPLDHPLVSNWIVNYQELLNRWRFWFERADFDLTVLKRKNERPVPQVYMSCTYCGKNISAHLRSLKNQQFSRINVSGTTTNKLTGCPHCRKPLSRCIICLMTMGSAIAANDSTPKTRAFDDWFTWCQSCRHGGHSKHITTWFGEHLECPMVGCSCKCYSLDFTTPAN